MDFHKHVENIDMKIEGARAGSVVGASGASIVAANEGWGMADTLLILTILYTLLQIGLLIIKYWKIWNENKGK